jgi:hypothetical protein
MASLKRDLVRIAEPFARATPWRRATQRPGRGSHGILTADGYVEGPLVDVGRARALEILEELLRGERPSAFGWVATDAGAEFYRLKPRDEEDQEEREPTRAVGKVMEFRAA